MAIKDLVKRGYGGTIANVVTRGFAGDAAPSPPVTVAGGLLRRTRYALRRLRIGWLP